MNKVILMGRCTKDPEVRWSQGEKSTAIGRITLAVDRKFKQDGQPTADYINCLAFGKRAEFLEKYCKKEAGRPEVTPTKTVIRCTPMSV